MLGKKGRSRNTWRLTFQEDLKLNKKFACSYYFPKQIIKYLLKLIQCYFEDKYFSVRVFLTFNLT